MLAYPLDAVLGREAHVRVLRELARHGGHLSAMTIATRSGLSKPSVLAALKELGKLELTENVGEGHIQVYRLRTDHPFAAPLGALFEAEDRRYADVFDAIRQAVAGSPDVMAAWIFGSAARGEDRPDSDLDIALVLHRDDAGETADRVRDALDLAAARLRFRPSVISVVADGVAEMEDSANPWWRAICDDARTVVGDNPTALLAKVRRMRRKEGASASA